MKTKKPAKSVESRQRPLFTIRLLLIATISLMVGIVIGVLTYLAFGNLSIATLAGLSSAGISLGRLHLWTEDPE